MWKLNKKKVNKNNLNYFYKINNQNLIISQRLLHLLQISKMILLETPSHLRISQVVLVETSSHFRVHLEVRI